MHAEFYFFGRDYLGDIDIHRIIVLKLLLEK